MLPLGEPAMKTSSPFQLLFLFIVTILGTASVCAGLQGDASPCVHTGAVDASAAAALDGEHFVAASDENSVLRVYGRQRGGPPLQSIDLARFLGVSVTSSETDIEGAARIGDRIYWISSHGRDKDGNVDLARYRFFATEVRATERGIELLPVGKPYRDLLADLLGERRLQSFKLAAAATLAPKSPGGLSIEGLCVTPEKHLLIGFRNPIPGGRALLVPLLNADAVVQGERAQFGAPIRLNLGGLGIRSMVSWEGQYLSVGGSYDGKGQSRLYRWAGDSRAPKLLRHVSFKGFNAEAIVVYPDEGLRRVQLLSDDSNRAENDRAGKGKTGSQERQFRSVWVKPQ